MSSKINKNFEENKYKIYGLMAKGKFKIRDDRKGKARSGIVCTSTGYTAKELLDVFKHVQHLPYDDEIGDQTKNMSKEELRMIISQHPLFSDSSYESKINKLSTNELRKLYTLFLMKKGELCSSLERWFKGENSDNTSYMIDT
jgi:hypothetical protein